MDTPLHLSANDVAGLERARQQLAQHRQLGPLTWHYAGYFGSPSCCRLQVFCPPLAAPLIVVTELDENPGTSVTNRAEVLAAELVRALDLVGSFRFVEVYETPIGSVPGPRFSAVTFAWDAHHQVFTAPRWQHLRCDEVDELLARDDVPIALRLEPDARGFALTTSEVLEGAFLPRARAQA